jgi:hypothetical protein
VHVPGTERDRVWIGADNSIEQYRSLRCSRDATRHSGRAQRQPELDGAAGLTGLTGLTGQAGQVATVRPGQRPRDRQAEAGGTGVAGPGVVEPDQPAEDALTVAVRDAGTRVADLHSEDFAW